MAALETYRKLGADRIAGGDIQGAIAPLRVARRLAPEDKTVGRVLGQGLFVLAEQDRLAGNVLRARERFAEAAIHAPDDPAIWNGLGQCCVAIGDVADGAGHYRHALTLRSDAATVYSNLANALVRLNDYDGATQAYERALDLRPGDPEIRHNHAFHLLRLGRLGEGWRAYRARLERPGVRPPLPGPEWDGDDPADRTIAVWSEQGVGDELMFGTCLPDLIARAGHVVWECAPKLADLLRRSFPSATVVARPIGAETAQTPAERFGWLHRVPSIDAWTGIASLPGVFRPEAAAFRGSGAYAKADPNRRARAAAWLSNIPRPWVGLCWRGGVVTTRRSQVYAAISDLAPMCRAVGIAPVVLQYRADDSELAAFAAADVTAHVMAELDLFEDIEGLAGLVAELDLVISAGTAVAELAGALGTPVWRFGPDSDFTLLGAGRRLWFESMRCFTKPDAEPDWSALFQAMSAELRVYSGLPDRFDSGGLVDQIGPRR